jgi:hypothetical protein
LVKIDNSWLKQANSENYHNVFPKSCLCNNKGCEKWQANTIINITIVDGYLNKSQIRARARRTT